MYNQIVYKTFKTHRYPYLYDRHTNSLVRLTEQEFNDLCDYSNSPNESKDNQTIRKFQEQGLLMPNVVERIEHSGTQIIEQYINTRIRQLTLQVTQQCNLRCEYCAYSGIYSKNRTHSNKKMSFETAKKAIDFFIKRSSALTEIVIGFYGGEPLLEFELIQQCVQYVKNKVDGKKIQFVITTNGTLLTDSIVDFLVTNEFRLSISIDGSKEEHDVNRCFVNGKGSFDVIMENIKRIRKRYPDYDKQISIMTTINPHSDLGCVLEYFTTKEVFADKNIIFSSMKETSLGQTISYDEKFYIVRNFEYLKMLFAMVDKIDKKILSPLVLKSMGLIEQSYKTLHRHTELIPVTHPGGPCMAGVRSLFVRYDGTLFPCERVNEELDYFAIGTLDNGIDVKKVQRLLNIGQITEKECQNCWCLRHCSICSEQIEFEDIPTKSDKLNNCLENKQKTYFDLYELCVLSEFGYNANRINNEE